MKMDQIAFYAHSKKQADDIKAMFGLQRAEWVEDIVEGEVTIPSLKIRGAYSKGHLQFNYDLGIELEILTYLEGPHWHITSGRHLNGKPFLSHIGIHLEEGEPFPETGLPLAQVMLTSAHTNPYIVGKGRTYHYVIADGRQTCGAFIKYIRRIENGETANA